MELNEVANSFYNKVRELLSDKEWMAKDLSDAAELEQHYQVFKTLAVCVSNVSNDYKLHNAWKCISQGLNEEAAINELYNYTTNADRAFYISNTMKKIILSNSNIASAVLAYIVGDIVMTKRDFTQEDVIMHEALSNMTDFDIKNFVQIMDNCIGWDELGEEYVNVLKIKSDEKKQFELTLKLCVNTRLFEMDSIVTNSVAINAGTFYKKTYISVFLCPYSEGY